MSEKRYGLPDEIFRYKDGEQEIVDEQQEVTPVEKIVFENGIYVHLEGASFPQKGIAIPETLFAMNLVKRHIIEPIKLLNKWYFYPGVLIMAMNIENVLKIFNDMTWRFVKPHVLNKTFMTAQTSEFEWLLYIFLKNVGISDKVSEEFSATIASAIEYDNAYRLRFVDMWTEVSKEALIANPRKEIVSLAKVLINRSVGETVTQQKFLTIAQLFSVVLLIPKYKKAFIQAIKETNIEKLRADEVDIYWMCLRKEWYNYMGLTDKERREYLKRKNLKKPLLLKRPR